MDFGDASIGDAVLDRLTHYARRLNLKGEPLRRTAEKSKGPPAYRAWMPGGDTRSRRNEPHASRTKSPAASGPLRSALNAGGRVWIRLGSESKQFVTR
ncbi:MAG: hypothetical protein AB7Q97_25765 [Gammaproteobacteria bacterium]